MIPLAAFAAAADVFLVPPMLAAIAGHHATGTAEAAGLQAAFLLAYGIMQLPWGVLSDRFGRVAAIRLALAGAGCGTLLFALAPSLDSALAARMLSGAMMAGVVPGCIACIGDSLAPAERPRAAAEMNMGFAAGTAAGTLAGGFAAQFLDWRVAAIAVGLFACWVGWATRRLQDAARQPGGGLRVAFASPSLRMVAALGLLQGALLIGGVSCLAPALLVSGTPAALAGLVAAAYGVAVVVWSLPGRAWLPRLGPVRACLLGGLLLVLGWLAPALRPDSLGVLLAALLAGGAWAFLQTTLQVWATVAAPAARGAAVAIFACALFVGAAIGTRLAQPLLASGQVGALFAVGAALAVLHTAACTIARRRFG